jgi:hypothetical protein
MKMFSAFFLLMHRFYSSRFIVNAAERTFATASVYSPPECFLSADAATHGSRNATFELILAEDYDELDGRVLTTSIRALKQRGAHRCWHKHSTFLEHLVGVHDILRLWGQGAFKSRSQLSPFSLTPHKTDHNLPYLIPSEFNE